MQEDYDIDYYLKKIENGNYNKKRHKVKAKKTNKNFKKTLKDTIVGVLLYLAIVEGLHAAYISSYYNLSYKDFLYYSLPHKVEQVEVNEFNDQINKYIWENNNIGETEKEVISNYYNESLKDQAEYFNNTDTLKKVQNLKIRYQYELSNGYLDDSRGFAGTCFNNYINMLSTVEFNDATKGVLIHEFNHILQENMKYTFIQEAITEENANKDTYRQERVMVGMLCYLVDKDAMLDYSYSGEDVLITDELCKIISNKLEGKKLLHYAEKSHNIYINKIVKYQHDIDLNVVNLESRNLAKSIAEQKECFKKFVVMYSKFYQAKYNKDMMDDPYLAACTDFLLGTNCFNTSFYDPIYLQMTSVQKNFLEDENEFKIDYVYNDGENCIPFSVMIYPDNKKALDLAKNVMDEWADTYLNNKVVRRYSK